MAESLHAPINTLPFENGEFTDAANALIVETLERVKQRIIDNMHSTNRWASGRTAESMQIEQYENGARLVGRPYMQNLEVGRGPGPVPGNMRDIIKQWILDKGISPTMIPYKTDRPHKYTVEERSLNAMAGAISYTIEHEGTSLYRAGGEENVYTPVINEELALLREQIGTLLVTKIKNK